VAELRLTPVAVVASLLWALDVNAIAINRIGKEDTFLPLFFLLAMWCYERARRQGTTDPTGAQRWDACSGASFGLMGHAAGQVRLTLWSSSQWWPENEFETDRSNSHGVNG
jgi:hypothetical protein